VAKLRSTGGVGGQEHDQLLPIVLGGSELDVVEFESAGVGVAETLARSFESSNRVFFPELGELGAGCLEGLDELGPELIVARLPG
jgi:hypothetical protein